MIAAIRDELAQRDQRDSTREDSPLAKADDAVLIDTSHCTIREQIEQAISVIMDSMAKR